MHLLEVVATLRATSDDPVLWYPSILKRNSNTKYACMASFFKSLDLVSCRQIHNCFIPVNESWPLNQS